MGAGGQRLCGPGGVRGGLQARDKRGRQYGDIWERRISVQSFQETNSSTKAIIERRKFRVAPGRYDASVKVGDANAGIESSASERIEVKDFAKEPVGFADLELGLVDSVGFKAVPTRRFGMEVNRIATRVVLFDRRPGSWPRTYPFRYRIEDENGGEVLSGVAEVSMSPVRSAGHHPAPSQ